MTMHEAVRRVWQEWASDEVPLRLGVSGCLLGEEVRYDGGHARDRFLADTLDRWVDWAPVCPEMDAGLGSPRPTVRLVENGDLRLVAPSTGVDLTGAMQVVSRRRVEEFGDLDGFVLKKNSPTCGLERIRVYTTDGSLRRKDGRGMFAGILTERWPQLPVEEEGRLNDPILRESFIERAFCRNRWRVLERGGLTRKRLVRFHTAHKLLVRSHDEDGYRRLGRIVASFGEGPDAEVYRAYELELQRTLVRRATRKKHANVMQHAFGYLKRGLDPQEKRQVLTAIRDFQAGLVPLVVPVTLLRFAIVEQDVEYLSDQLYFDPHPKELMLRNHV